MKQRTWLALGGLCLVTSGCALSERLREAADRYVQAEETVAAGQLAFGAASPARAKREASQEIDKPWLAGRARPLAREVRLPAALRATVQTTLLFAEGGGDLRRIAQRISRVTGIPVQVQPDALLPAWHFVPKLSGQPVAEPPPADGPMFGLAAESRPLPDILDQLCARLGIRWRYHQGRIEFFRTETRVFNVHALTLDAHAQASLGLGRDQNEGGFVSTSSTRLNSGEHDMMQIVRARIEPFLSRAGVLVADSGAGSSVVVTDLPSVLDRIAEYLDKENRALTRRVRLVFEELTVAFNEQAQASLDWNLVFASAQMAAGLAAPAWSSAESAGRLSIGITHGPLSGSEAIITALGDSVRLVRRSSVPMLTLNRRPVTHAVRTTFSYIDRVETVPVSGVNGLAVPAVSVNQKEETVGSLLTLVPDVQDNGQILLSLAYDNTVAQPLKTVTFGDKSNPLQLQQLTIEGNGTVQQLALQPGQPLIVSGFDRRQSESSRQRLGPDVPAIFGGGDALREQRLATVLIITARVEEGL